MAFGVDKLNEIKILIEEATKYERYKNFDKLHLGRLNYEYRTGKAINLTYWLLKELKDKYGKRKRK